MEAEVARRVEEEVARRVAIELERRRGVIEAEVARRVEAAKAELEAKLVEELQRKHQARLEDERRKEVGTISISAALLDFSVRVVLSHLSDVFITTTSMKARFGKTLFL